MVLASTGNFAAYCLNKIQRRQQAIYAATKKTIIASYRINCIA